MSIVLKGRPPKGGTFLLCDKARRGLGCVRAFVRYDAKESGAGFENTLLMFCTEIKAEEVMNDQGDRRKQDIAQKKGEIAIAQAEMAEAEPKIQRLLEDMLEQEDRRIRERMQARMVQFENRKELLAQTIEQLTREIQTISGADQDTERRMMSLKALIEYFARKDLRLDDPRRVQIRLRLREELQGLISSIDVFTEGFPENRMTLELARRLLDSVIQAAPGIEQIEEFTAVAHNLYRRVDHPREFPVYRVNFRTDSVLTIYPGQHSVPSFNLWELQGREEGKHLHIDPDGEVQLMEFSPQGIKRTKFQISDGTIQVRKSFQKRLFA